jgi:Bacterial protein of unknown function (DUF839)
MKPIRSSLRRGRHLAGTAVAAGVALSLVATAASAVPTPGQGPTSSQTPYLVGVAPGTLVQSIMTVGDAPNGTGPTGGAYTMVGIPDGLGQLDNGDGTYTLVMNHELGATLSTVRAHGAAGSFVSKWRIDKNTNAVQSGGDLINSIINANTGAFLADGPGGAIAIDYAIARLCSGDLAPVSAFYHAQTGVGTQSRIFLSGEETGAEGKGFAHVVTGPSAGVSYYLPSLGLFSWENLVASHGSGAKTIVVGTDDSTPGQVYFYIGDKQSTGNEAAKAGLVGGNVFGVKVTGAALEDRTTGVGGASMPFTLHPLGDVSALTGAQLQTNSVAAGITEFLRPEDGVFDPSDASKFYFVTTDRYDQVKDGVGAQVGRSRLWRLNLNSPTSPTGGTIDLLLDGTEAQNMFDNLTHDGLGHLILQEDPGNQGHLAKVWQYDIATDTLTLLLKHDPARFGEVGVPATAPFSQDEESSGVIPAFDILGPGWFLLDVQAHYNAGTTLVEGGQLLAFYNPDSDNSPEPVVPEAPYAVILAVSALAVLGGAAAFRKRGALRV